MPQYKQKPRSTPAPAPISEATKARIEESKRLQQVIAPQVQVQPQVQPQDDVGWTEVRRTKRKFKRELTVEEMDARERQRETQQEDGEFNTQLFESNRHDHDRV